MSVYWNRSEALEDIIKQNAIQPLSLTKKPPPTKNAIKGPYHAGLFVALVVENSHSRRNWDEILDELRRIRKTDNFMKQEGVVEVHYSTSTWDSCENVYEEFHGILWKFEEIYGIPVNPKS